jgi:hypothetical protein
MKKLHKIGALWLLLALLLTLAVPALAVEQEDTEAPADRTLYISSVDDFLSFAQSCTLDSYSEGLTVYLTADIDLTGVGFSPIPIFLGEFQGQGHTISGLTITGDGSHMGLFRYVETGARIADLTVSGTVAPGGSACMAGGIAGTNRGTLENCTFWGSVSGQEAIGGIAGVNEAEGLISGCENRAQLTGTAYVGGIVGRNMGSVTASTNLGDVNTVYVDGGLALSLPDLSVDRGDLGVVADVGGIAGQSTGLIAACQNQGTVGCASTGYNIGGIVGRQSGYVSQCQNSGTILGRKDVGGIVGQAEPHIDLDVDGSMLPTLTQELDTLHDLVNDTLADAKSASSAISAGFSAVGAYTYAAAQDAASLASQVQAGVDSLLTDWVQAWESLGYIQDNTYLFQTDWAQTSQDLTQSVQALLSSAGQSSAPEPEPENTTAPAEPDPVESTPAQQIDQEPMTQPEAAEQTPSPEGSPAEADELVTLDTPLSDTEELITDGQPETVQPETELETDAGPEVSDQALPDQAVTALTQLEQSVTLLQAHTQTLTQDIQALETLLAQDSADTQALTSYTDALSAHITAAVAALTPVQADIAALNTALAPYEQDMDGDIAALWQAIQTAGEQLSSLITDGNAILDRLDWLSELTLPSTGDSARTLDSMFQNLSGLGSCLSSLNGTVTAGAGTLADDLTAVNDQFNLVMQLVVQALSGQGDADITLFTDRSDLDTDEQKDGTVADCQNAGTIQGDLDVGGIAGAMAIEYDFDLEGDIFGSDGLSLSATYLTNCVLHGCENRGAVTARNDCVGGIVGLMEQGAVRACQSYGATTSADGDYVGGIAGQSLGTLRGCYALCTLSGGQYVGGIAGSGQRLYENRALVDLVDYQEQAGAIAGTLAEDGACADNLFVDRGLGGIDNISYAGQAEPVTYEDLTSLEDTPEAFSQLTITFQAQGETVAQVPFTYGQSLDASTLPTPPALDGYTGVWEDFDWDNLTFPATVSAVYTAYGATIAADSQRPQENSPLPLLLAEGSFYPEATLTADAAEDAPLLKENETLVEAWHVSITGAVDEESGFTLHYRLPDTKSSLALYVQRDDGTWEPTEYTKDGRYALFTITGPNAVFCVTAQPAARWQLWLGAALGAAVITISALALHQKRKKAAGAHLKGK